MTIADALAEQGSMIAMEHCTAEELRPFTADFFEAVQRPVVELLLEARENLRDGVDDDGCDHEPDDPEYGYCWWCWRRAFLAKLEGLEK